MARPVQAACLPCCTSVKTVELFPGQVSCRPACKVCSSSTILARWPRSQEREEGGGRPGASSPPLQSSFYTPPHQGFQMLGFACRFLGGGGGAMIPLTPPLPAPHSAIPETFAYKISPPSPSRLGNCPSRVTTVKQCKNWKGRENLQDSISTGHLCTLPLPRLIRLPPTPNLLQPQSSLLPSMCGQQEYPKTPPKLTRRQARQTLTWLEAPHRILALGSHELCHTVSPPLLASRAIRSTQSQHSQRPSFLPKPQAGGRGERKGERPFNFPKYCGPTQTGKMGFFLPQWLRTIHKAGKWRQ